MWNILMDKLPTEYKGFPINSDFRVGIQMFQALNDKELTERERIETALSLLFSDMENIPDFNTAMDGMHYFLSGWMTDKVEKNKHDVKITDYDIDQWRIYTAFRSQYGINLNKENLHFWEFMAMLSTLDDCAYTRVIDIRTRKIDNKMDPEAKKALKEAKNRYRLDEDWDEITPEEQEMIDNFLRYAKG